MTVAFDAQQACCSCSRENFLQKELKTTLKKLPTELVRSCSTGLYLRTDDIKQVKAVLSGKQIMPSGIYLIRRDADGQKKYLKVR